jgi:MinD superfamily P-loop ATPase
MNQIVWIDAERCTGCGVCTEVCADGAITLIDGTATVDEGRCTGCGACLSVCPREAIQPVVQGELVLDEQRSLEKRKTKDRLAPVIERSRPLVEAARPAVAAVGIGLLARTAGAMAQAVSRWLAEPLGGASTPTVRGRATGEPASTNGRGRRMRRRRRGR